MKHSYSWAIVCACAVVGAATAGVSLRLFKALTHSHFKLELASELSPSDPRYEEVMCGPISLSVALGRVGVSRLPADLAAQCKVTERGVSLADLESAANNTGLVTAHARRLSWDALTELDGVALLFVKGNHYIAVDPRETPEVATQDTKVRIYEPDKLAQWWTREKLAGIWQGEALVLTKHVSSLPDAQGSACIDWDECYLDQGTYPRDTPLARYHFAFRNVGSSDLVISDFDKSCGCLDPVVSKMRLAPGESADITIKVDLHGREGQVSQYVVVNTNDAKNPTTVLRVVGGVPRSRVTSTDVIRLEDLPSGGTLVQRFYVADPGFNGVTIRDASFALPSNPALAEHLTCSISHDVLGKEGQQGALSQGFHATPQDYEVRLAFHASAASPLGPFAGDVHLLLDADGVLTQHKVSIEGMIVQDVRPVPRVALITLDSAGDGSATIRLNSHSNRDMDVVRMWADTPASLQVRRDETTPLSDQRYIISAHIPEMRAGEPPLQRVVFFEMTDGSVASVPVALFKPPKQ